MSLGVDFSKLSLDESLVDKVKNLKFIDFDNYIDKVKLLRNDWFKLNQLPESHIYILLSINLHKFPHLINHWDSNGYPTTIYQFEYDVYNYTRN